MFGCYGLFGCCGVLGVGCFGGVVGCRVWGVLVLLGVWVLWGVGCGV